MDKICNFDIVINTCLAEINPTSLMPDFDKNGFLLSVINGFAYTRRRPSWAKRAFLLTSVTRRRPSWAKRAFLLTSETRGWPSWAKQAFLFTSVTRGRPSWANWQSYFIECLHSEFTVPYSGEMTLHKSGERPEQDLSPGHKISKIAVNNQRVRSEIHRCGVISRKHSVNPVFSA